MRKVIFNLIMVLMPTFIVAQNYQAVNGKTYTEVGGTSWDANEIVFSLSVKIDGNNAVFTVTKISQDDPATPEDETKFTSSGNLFLKVGDYVKEAVHHDEKSVAVGTKSVELFDDFSKWPANTYPKKFYVRYEKYNSDTYAWVGPITIEKLSTSNELIVESISTNKDWDYLYYPNGSLYVEAKTSGDNSNQQSINIEIKSSLTNKTGKVFTLNRVNSNTYSNSIKLSSELVNEINPEKNECFYFSTTEYFGEEWVNGLFVNGWYGSLALGDGIKEKNIPPATKQYLQAGGYEKLTITPQGIKNNSTPLIVLVANEADNVIYVGDGNSCSGKIKLTETNWISPSEFGKFWVSDVKSVLIFGCSVLNISDITDDASRGGNSCNSNTGRIWAGAFKSSTVKTILGFNAPAPSLGEQNAEGVLNNYRLRLIQTQSPFDAWNLAVKNWLSGGNFGGCIIQFNDDKSSYCYHYRNNHWDKELLAKCNQTKFSYNNKIYPNETREQVVNISDLTAFTAIIQWPGSDIDLEITTPTGKILKDTDEEVKQFYTSGTYDFYTIAPNETGDWKFNIIAIDVDPNGEEFSFEILQDEEDLDEVNLPKFHVPSEYAKIQDAIEAANNSGGGMIVVSEGTYKENLTVYNNTYVISENNNPLSTIIDGNGKQNTLVFNGCLNGGLVGFTIRNSGKNGNFAGIKIAGGEQAPIIANCIITDNGHGLFIQGNAQPFIINNTIAYNSGKGLRTGGNSPASIVNNIVAFNGDFEIERNGGHDFHMLSGNCLFDTDNYLYDKIEAGENDILHDPLFLSEIDLQLQSGSPCINACKDLKGQQTDIGALGSPEFDWIQAYQTELIVSTGNINSEKTGIDIDLESRKKSGTEYTTMITKSGYIHEPTFTKLENTKMYIISSSISESATMTFSDFEASSVVYKFNETTNVWELKSRTNQVNTNDLSGIWALTGNMVTSIENKLPVPYPFKLFPNPTDGNLTVEYLNASKSTTIRVFDLSGKLLINEQMTGQRINIDLTKFGNQTLILQIKDRNKIVGSQKIMIK